MEIEYLWPALARAHTPHKREQKNKKCGRETELPIQNIKLRGICASDNRKNTDNVRQRKNEMNTDYREKVTWSQNRKFLIEAAVLACAATFTDCFFAIFFLSCLSLGIGA